jgi:hypothetical protein
VCWNGNAIVVEEDEQEEGGVARMLSANSIPDEKSERRRRKRRRRRGGKAGGEKDIEQAVVSVSFPGFPDFPGSRRFFHSCFPGKSVRDSRE